MTTFAKKELTEATIQASFEIKSLNSRFCDINIKIPKWMGVFEEKIRKIIYSEMKRGKIDFFINIDNMSEINPEITPDINLAKSYLEAIKNLSENTGIPFQMDLSSFILCCRDVLISKKNKIDIESLWEIIENPLNELIADAIKHSSLEGANLKADIEKRITTLYSVLDSIRLKKQLINDKLKNNVRDRIAKFIGDMGIKENVNEDRLLQEIGFYIDRMDITEELVRAASHLKLFQSTLDSGGEAGKRLDFLIQELLREFNTMGNKAADDEISHFVVDAKVELEKIREQVQNIV